MAQQASSRQALVATSGVVLPGDLLAALCERASLGLGQLAALTSYSALSADSLPKAAFDIVLAVADAQLPHTAASLTALAASLRPGGSLLVQQPVSAEGEAGLRKQLLLGGLVDIATTQSFPAGEPAVALKASKPQWEAGAKASITLKSRAKVGAAPASPAPASTVAVWKMAVDDEVDELLDDEDFLTEEDKQRPPAPAADDCEAGTSGRKACKNCSCGRAEMEAAATVKPVLTTDMLENPTSSCGSCALGDAFRCAGCPYRGLPAFEMGKKIELPSDFLTADA